MLIQDRNVRIINAATGELIRELTIDPTRNYQPRGVRPVLDFWARRLRARDH